MLNLNLSEKFGKDKRLAVGSVFLVANAFIWYFFAARILEETINKVAADYSETLIMWSLHFGALALSALLGVRLMQKIGRRKLFIAWTMLGVLSPLTLLALNFFPIPITSLISVLFGVSLGLGMPNCMEHFRRLTTTENRGRYGGIIMLISGLGLFSLAITDVGNIELNALILIVWRLAGFAFLLLPVSIKKPDEIGRNVSYGFVLNQRSFIMYLLPWILFSLVNYLSTPVQFSILGEAQVKFLLIIENALVGSFAVIGGFLADYFGRKRTAISGFVMLGLGFSVLGLFPNELASWYFYTVVDGVAWGILYVVFVISIWGDLSYDSPSDKYYAIGVLPFFISKFLQLVMGNIVAAFISPYALFSFTAFFLFIAVLPLTYAPEPLSEKQMKDRELRNYLEKAQKFVQKEDEKNQKKQAKKNPEQSDGKKEENNEEYDEARKLAEKYY